MNVLLITCDSDVLRDGSPAQALLIEQANVTNRLMVVVLNSRHMRSHARKVTERLWLFPINVWAPFLTLVTSLYIVRHEIFFRNRLQADLIVGNDPLSAGFVACVISRRYKKPLHIFVPRNIFSSIYSLRSVLSLFRSVFARLLIGLADTISVTREATRAALIRRDPAFAGRVTFVPPYIDVAATQAQELGDDLHLKYTQFRAILLVVAPLVREHNVSLAIDVLAELSKYHENIGLVIVGNGPRKWFLKRYAGLRGVQAKVMFERPREDLTSYYKSAYVFIVPSLYEEYETTIEDAAAAGSAIVSSPVGMAPQLIEHGKSGYLCDPKNPSEYWNVIGTLIRNSGIRESIRRTISLSTQGYMTKDKSEHIRLLQKAWEGAINARRGY